MALKAHQRKRAQIPPRHSSNAYYRNPVPQAELHFPALDIGSYYSFLSELMIILFVVGLVIIFVYEYEALRRSRA